MSSRTTTVLFTLALSTTALAGCLGDTPTSQDDVFSVARVFTVDLDRDSASDMEGVDTPQEALDALVETSLVVRVGAPGAYALTYEDENGREKTETLVDLLPGRPHEVRGADALTFATLKDVAGKVVASRPAISADWWRAGDVPLGVVADAPARAVYDYVFDSRLTASVENVDSEDGKAHLDSLVASLGLPIVGELRWDLADDGSEDRLDLKGQFHVDDSRGSLASFEAKGTMDGKAGTYGAEVLSGGASVEGHATLWLRDGQLSAAQLQRGAFAFAPKVIMWAEGEFFEGMDDVPCAGKSRADQCEVEEIPAESDSTGPEPKEVFEDADFEIDPEDAEGLQALEFVKRLLAQDLQVHDQLTVVATTTEEDFGADPAADFTVRFTYEMAVPAEERVTIPAGTFQALRVTQTAKLFADVEEYAQERCLSYGYEETYPPATPTPYPDGGYGYSPTPMREPSPYGCQESERQQILRELNLDETLARTTIWLEADSFQPLKVTVDSPLDVDAFMTKVIRAAGEDFWTDLSVRGIDPDNLGLTAATSSEIVAREIAGDARFAPYVGLFLATAMGNGANGVTGAAPGMLMGGFPMGPNAEVLMPPARAEPSAYVSMYSAGPLDGDEKRLVVADASPHLGWYDLGITVDGASFWNAGSPDCAAADAGSFTVCGSDAAAKAPYDMVASGDVVTLKGVSEGQTLRVIDVRTNSVVLTMTIV